MEGNGDAASRLLRCRFAMIALCRLSVVSLLVLDVATPAQHEPAWTWLAAKHAPSESSSPSFAFDLRRNQVVLFGDYTGETWEWTGSRWHQRVMGVSPSPRGLAAMAYDPVNRAVLLFGGYQAVYVGPTMSDTWSYDGTAWTRLQPAASPSARGAASIATDPLRNRIVLQGGHTFQVPTGTVLLADTWEWDGANWILRQPVHQPPAAFDSQLAFDASVGRVVHVNADGNVREWDGQDWLTITPAVPGPVRSAATACSDPTGAGVLLLGGSGPFGIATETWRWFAGVWSRLSDPPGGWFPRDAFVVEGNGTVIGHGYSRTWTTCRFHAGTNSWSIANIGPLTGGSSSWGTGVAIPDGSLVMLQGNGQTWRIEAVDAVAVGGPGGGPQSVSTMAYDHVHGWVLATDFAGNTYRFDGQQWVQVATLVPQARLVGHHSGSGRFLAYAAATAGVDLWGLDANGWVLLTNIPGAGYWSCSAAMDSGRDTFVLLDQSTLYEWNGTLVSRPAPNLWNATLLPYPTGGVLCRAAATVHWDGATWTPLPAMPWDALGCDVAGQRYFRVGGEWLHPFGLHALPGDPAVGATVMFSLSEPLGQGRAFWLLLAAADSPPIVLPPVAHGVPLRLPLANDWLLAASVTAGGMSGTLDANGRATLSLAIPNWSGLLGFGFHAAALLLPSASGVTEVTNGVKVWVHR